MLNKLINFLLPALGKNVLRLSAFSIVLAFSFSKPGQEEIKSLLYQVRLLTY